MIRFAFVGVLALGCLIAVTAFLLARGSESDVAQIRVAPDQTTAPTPVATPEVDRLYYLREIDFDQGEITVVLFPSGDGNRVIVRDQDILRAAAPEVYVNTSTSTGQAAGSFALAMLGAPPTETVVEIYRNDLLIASVSCTNTACGSFASERDANHANLLDHGVPFDIVRDAFDDHEIYLNSILAITEHDDFMFLGLRPQSDFPSERRVPSLTLALPSVVQETGQPFDPIAHRDRVRAAIEPILPEEATLERVVITPLGQAVVGDADNGQPVTAGGAPIPFPFASFHSVKAQISGISALPSDVIDGLTDATRTAFNVDPQFERFVNERLQSTCVDCFFLKVDGDYYEEARLFDWRSEYYSLDYFDLRDAP